ncbi:MAG: hypothetical protein KC444_08440 [Nitrosopumilus sp.]|nr:hypothetical protein [Nitrosopumilus sp.]
MKDAVLEHGTKNISLSFAHAFDGQSGPVSLTAKRHHGVPTIHIARMHQASMTEFVVCPNCGLTYSVKDHESCSHCRFTISIEE